MEDKILDKEMRVRKRILAEYSFWTHETCEAKNQKTTNHSSTHHPNVIAGLTSDGRSSLR
jgi:hypothetical protein